jgi:hypothetical protein
VQSKVSFTAIFVAVVLATAMIVTAFLIQSKRPSVERSEPSSALVEATGKCAECHRHETGAIVEEYQRSHHAQRGVNCLDCHHPVEGQPSMEHRGFVIAKRLTAKNCAQCHALEYDQFARSRHAGPSWAAVEGPKGFSEEQIALGEKYHPGWIKRPANPLTALIGTPGIASGCNACHSIGRPNEDGSFGTCTQCHSRHSASVALAREPTTCGQCHMGPDHSQIEIYEESKHGVIFVAQRPSFRLGVAPRALSVKDMPVPTCATCHMSGLEGAKTTHDPGDRLSYFLFAAVSTKRPNGDRAQLEMKEICQKCHAKGRIEQFYTDAEAVLVSTNQKVKNALDLVTSLQEKGLVSKTPFSDVLDFEAFDLWHYYGRTTKHAAFMGGADFVQWHGNYELLRKTRELEHRARELEKAKEAVR